MTLAVQNNSMLKSEDLKKLTLLMTYIGVVTKKLLTTKAIAFMAVLHMSTEAVELHCFKRL